MNNFTFHLKIFILISFYIPVNAQSYQKINGLVTFQNKPMKLYKLHFEGHGEIITNTDGTFELTISESYKNSDIAFNIDDTLVVIEPSDKRLPILTRADYAHKILLGSTKEKNDFLLLKKEINNRLKRIEDKSALQTELLLNEIQQSFKEYNKSIGDSIAQLHFLKDELEYVIEKEKRTHRIKTVVPKIDSVYDIYISRTKDLRDAMIQYGEKVFYNPTYTNFIQQRIDGYNEAYELLNGKKGFILNNVELYWDDDLHDEVFDFIEDITLYDFHKQVILKSSIAVVNSITAFNNREKGRRKKTEIKNDISELIVDLNTNIERISSSQKSIVQKLKI